MKVSYFPRCIVSPNHAIYIALTASLLVSACSESQSTQSSQLEPQGVNVEVKNFEAKANVIEASDFKAAELANLSSDTSAHWLTSELLVLPKSVYKYQYQLLSKKHET